jgi:hypothetical protein
MLRKVSDGSVIDEEDGYIESIVTGFIPATGDTACKCTDRSHWHTRHDGLVLCGHRQGDAGRILTDIVVTY